MVLDTTAETDCRRAERGDRQRLLMFLYSFLAMTAYNIVQPITRSRFISALGAENLPYVLLVSVFLIGLIMQGYSKLGSLLPARWIIPATQAIMVGLLLGFWTLFGSGTGSRWASTSSARFTACWSSASSGRSPT